MNGSFNQVKADKIIRLAMSLAFVLILFHGVSLAFSYTSLPPLIPLFNQMPWGEGRLGTRLEIVIPLSLTIFFFIFNYFLLIKLYKPMPLISRIVSITTFSIALLSFIFIVRTLQLIL